MLFSTWNGYVNRTRSCILPTFSINKKCVAEATHEKCRGSYCCDTTSTHPESMRNRACIFTKGKMHTFWLCDTHIMKLCRCFSLSYSYLESNHHFKKAMSLHFKKAMSLHALSVGSFAFLPDKIASKYVSQLDSFSIAKRAPA